MVFLGVSGIGVGGIGVGVQEFRICSYRVLQGIY